MKALFAGLLVAVMTQGSPAVAQAADASRLPGRWAVDVSQLPMPEEARPKRVTFAFSETDAGKWALRVQIIQADGSERVSNAAFALDGSTVPIAGDTLEADAVAARRPAPDVLVLALGKEGSPASTRVYTLAPDGDSMIETAVYFGKDGKAIMRSYHLARIP